MFLRVRANMRHPVERRPRREGLRRHAGEDLAVFGFDGEQELVDAHAVDHVFHPRLQAVGAIAGLDEDAHDGVRDHGRVFRFDDDAGIPGEIPVAGNAADSQPKPDPGLDTETVLHLDSGERDVVGVLKHRDLAGAVERDVELARQPG